jgi:macrolide-specific efflux system membrane fusion protein
MKYLKFLTAFLLISGLIFLSISCSSGDSPSTTKTTIATARKGTISAEVTGTGNLALSHTEDLAFEIAGTVEAVLVEAGESVTEGQELARLDTSVWDDQIKSLEQAMVTAQRYLTAKESSLIMAQRQVTSKELAVRAAELDLETGTM